MPTYEFRCADCGRTFTEQRPMAASGDPAVCPDGHPNTTRLLTMAGAIVGAPEPRGARASGGRPSGAAGCCGGGCCA